MKTLILCSALLLILGPCKEQEKSAAANTTTDTSAKSGDNYGLVVSFYSIGMGIDGDAAPKFKTELVEKLPEGVSCQTYGWGREGEVDYCFDLRRLKDKDRQAFVDKVRQQLEGAKWVHINENSPCSHKDWGK